MQSPLPLLRHPNRLARALALAGAGVALAITASSASAACTAPATTATNGKCQVKFLADGTFTVPSGVTTVDLLVVGGGAGGGGVSAGTGDTGAGGAGGQARTIMGTAVTPGAEIPVTVGTGGAGGTTGVGADGALSSFGSPLDLNTLLTRAFGGYAGSTSSRGGQTLANSVGYITIPGGVGDLQGSGGGGGSGGDGGKGGAVTGGAGTGIGGSGGAGVDAATDFALTGSTIFGAGGGGAGTTTGGQGGAATAGNGGGGASPAGQSATANFGGGGGGGNGTAVGGSGGAGGSGVVLVQYAAPAEAPVVVAIATAVGSTTTKRLPNGRFQTSLALTLTSAGRYTLSTRNKKSKTLALLKGSKLGTTTLRRGAYTISYTGKSANERVTYSAVTLRRPPTGSSIKVVLLVGGKGKTVSFPIK